MSANGPRRIDATMQLGLIVQAAMIVFELEPAGAKKLTSSYELHQRQQALARNQQNPCNPKPAHFAKSDTPANRKKR